MSTLTEQAKERDLQRMQGIALAVLLLAVGGLALSVAQGAQGGWAWVKAFCEAAAVGALADWFAVVALFRKPLGLPIPHTALIPRNKERIADSLAEFVRDKFLSPESLLEKLTVFNPAKRLGDWLQDEQHTKQLTETIRTVALEGVGLVGESSVKQSVNRYLDNKIREWDASTTAAQVISLLTKDGRHHQLLDVALERVRDYLDAPETRELIATKIVEVAKRDYPKIIAIVDTFASVDKIGGSLAAKVSLSLVDEVHAALSQPQHQIRVKYEAYIHQFVEQLQTDEAFRQQVEQIKTGVSQSTAVRDYLDGLWDDIRAALESDLNRDDSVLMTHLGTSLKRIGRQLSDDPALAQALNDHLLAASSKLVDQFREIVTKHISTEVRSWKDEALVKQIELNVGRDLQFIRLNGTVVGGLIGLSLHAVSTFFR